MAPAQHARKPYRDAALVARAALDAGDIGAARAAVTAALALDPDYLAARDLGDRIEAAARAGAPPGHVAQRAVRPDPPVVSADGWARFEHRARQRRIEKRSLAAREAIAAGRLDEAREIIEVIREIDGLQLLDQQIGRRKAFPNAASAGRSVMEYSPRDPKACDELHAVISAVYAE